MKTITVVAKFEASYELEVPDEWEFTGIDDILAYDDLSAGGAELIDCEVYDNGRRYQW